jgi:hypothetical protein
MSDLVVQEHVTSKVTFQELTPPAKVAEAVSIANLLRSIIDDRKLFVVMNSKKHVTVEGWQLLGNFLQILPRERSITRHIDGSYEAYVELVDRSGHVVGGSSSLCGMDEPRWSKANEYARRSMAVTRATGKAYRLAFSWVMNLAGYEVTPAEEMPVMDVAPQQTEKAVVYTGAPKQRQVFAGIAAEFNIKERLQLTEVSDALRGTPMPELRNAIKRYVENPLAAEGVN